MKKSVNNEKFFPQESIKVKIAPARNTYLIFRLSINKAKIPKKKTTIPIYAGAAT